MYCYCYDNYCLLVPFTCFKSFSSSVDNFLTCEKKYLPTYSNLLTPTKELDECHAGQANAKNGKKEKKKENYKSTGSLLMQRVSIN